MGIDKMVDEIAAVRSLTDKPFGVDLLTAAPGDMEKQVQAIIDGGGRVFVAGLGVPRDVIDDTNGCQPRLGGENTLRESRLRYVVVLTRRELV